MLTEGKQAYLLLAGFVCASVPLVLLACAWAQRFFPLPKVQSLSLLAISTLAFLCCIGLTIFARQRTLLLRNESDLKEVAGFSAIALLRTRNDDADASMLRLAADVESAYRSDGARTFVLTAAGAVTEIADLTQALKGKLAQLGFSVIIIRAGDLIGMPGESQSPLQGKARQHLPASDVAVKGRAAHKIQAMKGQCDFVLIEAPALLTSIETEYVARHADAAILVAEFRKTLRQEWADAVAFLRSLHLTVLGAVLEQPWSTSPLRVLQRPEPSSDRQPATSATSIHRTDPDRPAELHEAGVPVRRRFSDFERVEAFDPERRALKPLPQPFVERRLQHLSWPHAKVAAESSERRAPKSLADMLNSQRRDRSANAQATSAASSLISAVAKRRPNPYDPSPGKEEATNRFDAAVNGVPHSTSASGSLRRPSPPVPLQIDSKPLRQTTEASLRSPLGAPPTTGRWEPIPPIRTAPSHWPIRPGKVPGPTRISSVEAHAASPSEVRFVPLEVPLPLITTE